jgi:hypothetical protein
MRKRAGTTSLLLHSDPRTYRPDDLPEPHSRRLSGICSVKVIADRLPYLRHIARRRLDNTTDAEDAVQDAFLAAWKHLDQFKGQAQMSTWLTTIVLNSSRMLNRKRSHFSQCFRLRCFSPKRSILRMK